MQLAITYATTNNYYKSKSNVEIQNIFEKAN